MNAMPNPFRPQPQTQVLNTRGGTLPQDISDAIRAEQELTPEQEDRYKRWSNTKMMSLLDFNTALEPLVDLVKELRTRVKALEQAEPKLDEAQALRSAALSFLEMDDE